MKDDNLVVIIDDDQEDHEIFGLALAQLEKPLKLLAFSDCEHALTHFQNPTSESPAFVFLDLSLPRIDGRECLVQLQKLSEFARPFIVTYSASIPPEWYASLEGIGANKFLEKSGSFQFLVEQLKELLDDH